MFNNASLLITGGTGSFGQHFIRHVLQNYQPRRIVVYSRDEFKQFEMDNSLADYRHIMRYFIGDVRDEQRLFAALNGVDYVVHAAAMKQVTASEYNPFEAVKTNIIGAENVVRAAIANSVKQVVALSTDKAASPVNLYGATKLASDKIFIAGNNMVGARPTRFSVVRYGNVVGSRGSVVPFFQRLLEQGVASLPVTDERMTRFWITLDQGVNFVLSSFELMQGGEIFVPKIPSMRILDLIEALKPGMPHHLVGIRPGEKLHETMITEDDSRHTIELQDRFVILPEFVFWGANEQPGYSGQPVAPGFHYSSDNNPEWLDVDGMRQMIRSASPQRRVADYR